MHEYCLIILLQTNGSPSPSNDRTFALGVIQHLESENLNRKAIYQMNTSFKKSCPFSQKYNLLNFSRRKQDRKIKRPVQSSDLQLNLLRLKSIKNLTCLKTAFPGGCNLKWNPIKYSVEKKLSTLFCLALENLCNKCCKKKQYGYNGCSKMNRPYTSCRLNPSWCPTGKSSSYVRPYFPSSPEQPALSSPKC